MKRTTIVLVSLLILLSGSIFYFLSSQKPASEPPQEKPIYDFDTARCPGDQIKFDVPDPYIRGLVEMGHSVDVVLNWYACHEAKISDLVLYRYSHHQDPVIRRVVAAPGDQFSLEKVESLGWVLLVNGAEVRGVNQERYIFGSTDEPPLKLAEKSRDGVLREREVILFSSFGPGDRDSGTFGVLSLDDVVGQVQSQ